MAAILILYSTTDGQTLRICHRLKQVLESAAHSVTLLPVADYPRADLASFDTIVVGAAIRYGKHHPAVFDFIGANRLLLDSKPNAFFSVNVVARKAAKNTPETNPYVQKFLRQTSWQPRKLAVFAGRLDYPRYRFLDRWMIRFIMWMTQGPTDPSAVVEFTDWEAVDAFSREVEAM